MHVESVPVEDDQPAAEAIEIQGHEDGGFMAVAADPEAAHKELQNAPSQNLGRLSL